MKMPHLLLVLVLILQSGCEPSESLEFGLNQDIGLRAIEGIQTISGSVRVPSDAVSYEITYLKFQGGEFVGVGGVDSGPVKYWGVDSLPLELLWRPREDEGPQAVLHYPGSSARYSDEIFAQEYTVVHSGTDEHFEGYQVVGYATSFLKNDKDQQAHALGNVSPILEYAIQRHRYVVALGVKFLNE
jgi:hypothetical protein